MYTEQFNFTENQNVTWFRKVDPRVKIGLSLFLFIITMIIQQWYFLAFLFIYIIILDTTLFGIRHSTRYIWSLKYFIAIFAVIFLVFYIQDIDAFAIVIFKILNILTSFSLLNNSTTPDEITDALLKLRIPPKISWSIGIILRQSSFMIQEYQRVFRIQEQRLYKIKNRQRKLFLAISIVISNLINHSIIRSVEFHHTLISRQFQGPHHDIIYRTSQLKKIDLIVILLALPPTILLLTSIKLFML